MLSCSNCQRALVSVPEYTLMRWDGEAILLCNVSCLTEWVWKERESRPKLSKSNQESK